MKIAFLGTGAMGSRMIARLVEAGHQVTAWNRTQRNDLPAQVGHADTPSQAAADADLVFSMVRDDAASRAVWLGDEGALATLKNNAVGIECSTVSLFHASALSAAFEAAGRSFLDAPLAGSRPQAENGALVFFVGGAPESMEQALPAFNAMGNAVHHLGAAGAGTLAKLMVNGLFGAQLALMGELLGMAGKTPHDINRLVEAVCATPVASPALALAAKAMLQGAFAPAFPIDLVAKDFDLLGASGQRLGAALPLATTCAEIFTAAREEGYGGDNITGIAQRYQDRPA